MRTCRIHLGQSWTWTFPPCEVFTMRPFHGARLMQQVACLWAARWNHSLFINELHEIVGNCRYAVPIYIMYQRIQTELLITRVQAVSQTCRDAMWFPSWQLDNSPLLTLSSIWGCKIVNLHHCITVSQYIFRLLVSDGWPASTGLFKGCGLKATAETEWNNMTDISQKNS